MDTQNNSLNELAAALNDHQITDDQGAIKEEEKTSLEEPAASEEQTTVEESATVEKPVETETKAALAEDEESEMQPAEDETGKRYVPEKRFKKVYGEAKEWERKAKEFEAKVLMSSPANTATQQSIANQPIDRTAVLETEILKGKLPQFDPESDQYDSELDELGGQILAANPGITKIDAARKALKYAEKLSAKVAGVQSEARLVKSIQSDQGITSRVLNRQSEKVDPSKLTLEEKEKWLKANGQW